MLSTLNFAVVGGVGGGIAAFLISWAGKHMLDRLILPRLLDRWATFSKVRALKRANKMISKYSDDVLATSIPNDILFEFIERIALIVVWFACLFMAVTFLIFAPTPNIYPTAAMILNPMLVGCSLLEVLYWSLRTLYDARRRGDLVRNPNMYARYIVNRVARLWLSAGYDQEEIKKAVGNLPKSLRVAATAGGAIAEPDADADV